MKPSPIGLITGALLAWTLPLHAAITRVQPTAGLPVAATQCSAGTSCNYTMPSQPTAGNALIASVSFGGAALSSVTDTATNSYSSTTSVQTGSGSGCTAASCIQVWYATNIATAGSFNVTSNSGTSQSMTVFAAEYSGIQNASPVDKQAQGQGTGTSVTTSSTTATNANSLYYGAMVHDGSGTVTIAGGGSFTEISEAENTANQVQGTEDIISSAAQTTPFTLGASSAWGDKLVIFIPAAGCTPTRTLLGVGC